MIGAGLRLRFGALLPLLALAQGVQPGEQTIEDFACLVGPRAVTWASAKQRFRSVFLIQAPWALVPKEVMISTLDSGVADLRGHSALAPELSHECGLGKLSIQLMTMSTIEDPSALAELFAGVEQLSAPVLTMLLDVPWLALAQSGWPIFGLLSQINVRKGQVPGLLNDDAIDGMQDPRTKQFLLELMAGLDAKEGIDGVAVQRAAGNFMDAGVAGSPLGLLTAMAAQASVAPDAQERVELLNLLQKGFKNIIGSGQVLDVALSTKWPLWGLIHMAIDMLAP